MNDLTTYSIASDTAEGAANLGKLQQEIADSGCVLDLVGLPARGDTIIVQGTSIEDADALTAIVAAHVPESLDEKKHKRCVEIDLKTTEMIDNGFLFSDKVFSLSLPAQSKLSSSFMLKDHPLFTYPVKWYTKDDDGSHPLNSSAELEMFYMTAIATVRAHLEFGTALKDQVLSASDSATVDGVIDPR